MTVTAKDKDKGNYNNKDHPVSGKPDRGAHRLAPFADSRSLFVAQLTLRRGESQQKPSADFVCRGLLFYIPYIMRKFLLQKLKGFLDSQ
jgi:hypothetical protein